MTFRPRIRSIKPEMWQDEKVGALSRDARLLFVGLITMADDEGRLRGMGAAVLGHVFPYDEDALRKLSTWLEELVASRLVVAYETDGVRYFYLPGFARHQVVNKANKSTLPAPPTVGVREPEPIHTVQLPDQSGSAPVTVRDVSDPSRARGGSGSGSGTDQPPLAPPADAGGGPSTGVIASLPRNSRALGTNPRAVNNQLAATVASDRALVAVGGLTEPTEKDRTDWERLQPRLVAAVGDQFVIASHIEALALVGVDGDGRLVLDGPDEAWAWSRQRFHSALLAHAEAVGVGARFATADEHAGLHETGAAA